MSVHLGRRAAPTRTHPMPLHLLDTQPEVVPPVPLEVPLGQPGPPARSGASPAALGACAWMGFGALTAQLAGPLTPTVLAGGALVATGAAVARSRAPGRLANLFGSLLGTAVIGAALWGLVCWRGGPDWVAAAAVVGLLAALAGDVLVGPCPLGWPLAKHRVGGWLHPGGRIERHVLGPALVVGAVLLAYPAAGTPIPPLPGQHTGQLPGPRTAGVVDCGRR